MAQQTAVEWLIEQIKYIDKETYATLFNEGQFEQAKQMEKEQIEKEIDDALNAYGIIKKN